MGCGVVERHLEMAQPTKKYGLILTLHAFEFEDVAFEIKFNFIFPIEIADV